MAVCGQSEQKHIVRTQEGRNLTSERTECHLDCSLVGLSFNSQWLPDAQRRHVRQASGLSVNTPTDAVVLSVFGLRAEVIINKVQLNCRSYQ